MATIERTAYPRFPEVLAPRDLKACYTPLHDELEWARRSTRGERPRLGLLVLLKVFQQLHYFPVLGVIPDAIVDHVRTTADISDAARFGYDTALSPTLFRHYAAVRAYLDVKPYYGTDANAIATRAAHTASLTMDQQVDIINAERANSAPRMAGRQDPRPTSSARRNSCPLPVPRVPTRQRNGLRESETMSANRTVMRRRS